MFYPPVKFGGDMSSDFCVIMLTHTRARTHTHTHTHTRTHMHTHTHTHIPVYRAADHYTHATPATL